MFPDSSAFAYSLAVITSVPDVIVWCDVQLTKDGAGICAPYLNLQNSTSIADVFQNKQNTYVVNGISMKGWFSIDFTLNDLANVYCKFEFPEILLVWFLSFLNNLLHSHLISVAAFVVCTNIYTYHLMLIRLLHRLFFGNVYS